MPAEGKAGVQSATAAVPLLRRDLGDARAAFTTRDASASAIAHKVKSGRPISASPSSGPASRNAEPHVQGGEYVKLIVFGGLDGILTSFAIVAGAAGVGLSVKAVLGIGISNVLADALAMGVGEYLSTKSEHEYIMEEHARESWEFKNFPEGEVAEMVDIFVGRGVSQEDAQVIIDRMSKYPEFFVNLMMTEELGLQMPDEQERVLLRAVVMFGAFASFGMLPIFGYVAASFFVQEVGDSQSQAHMMVAACVITSITLVALGAFKAHFAHRRYLRAAFETLLLGSACASVSYYVGQAVSSVDW